MYWVGRRNESGTYEKIQIEQPQDRNIFLADILEHGAKTWLSKSHTIDATYYKGGTLEGKRTKGNGMHQNAYRLMAAEPVFIAQRVQEANEIKPPFYEVKSGTINAGGKPYKTKLDDGIYKIRKLTITECKRLQTVPDSYEFPTSNAQAYKMLGNGWTVEVIAHILRSIKNEGR